MWLHPVPYAMTTAIGTDKSEDIKIRKEVTDTPGNPSVLLKPTTTQVNRLKTLWNTPPNVADKDRTDS